MTSIPKNLSIDKLDDIVNKYNNTSHKNNQNEVFWCKAKTLMKKIIRKLLNSKLVIMSEYQTIKILLQEALFQIGLKKFLWLKKVKNTAPWTYVISDLDGEQIIGTFYKKKNYIKKIKKNLEW